MEQTPVHNNHNPDLLRLIPVGARRIVEVGCSSGALAREYKKLNPAVHYTGIEIEAQYAELARAHCDRVLALDIELADSATLGGELAADCWVFGDVLEHLRDPWQLLARIRSTLPVGGCVVTCIPNAQHWSVLARLAFGDFRYEAQGLMDRTHIRWLTRQSMIRMFIEAGYAIEESAGRMFAEPRSAEFLPLIRELAAAAGGDPDQAESDARVLQFVFRAVAA